MLLHLAVALSFLWMEAKTPESVRVQPKCLATWQVDRGENPWWGLTSSAEAETRANTVAATRIGNRQANEIRILPGLEKWGEVLLRSPKGTSVQVNSQWFGNLTRYDVTRELAKRADVGIATPFTLSRFSPAEIAEVLVRYQLLRTYVHLEATVCLENVTRRGDTTDLQISGSHIYYTSKKHKQGFAFVLRINHESGMINVSGKP